MGTYNAMFLPDGSVEYPYDIYDFMQIVEDQMGPDARRYLEEFLDGYTNFDIETGEAISVDKTGETYHDQCVEILDKVRDLQHLLETRQKCRKDLTRGLSDLEHFIVAKM